MSYQLTSGEKKLPEAIKYLEQKSDIQGECLQYCRDALATIEIVLPTATEIIAVYGHSTAIGMFHILIENPAKYGWKLVNGPNSVHPILLQCFNRCGYENGLYRGHVALLEQSTGWLRSSKDYKNSPDWESKLVGSFIPL
jgi:hypothetical protein